MTVRQAVRSALGLLTPRDRRLLRLSILIQMCTSVLDLIGVLLIGLVGALAVTTVQSQPAPALVQSVADRLGLADLSDQGLVFVLAALAAGILLTKSILNSWLTRRVLVFLANRQALISARLTNALLSQPLSFLRRRSTQETAYSLISGAGAATSTILGQLVVAASELALLVVLAIALLLISPWVALGAIAFFAVIAFVLYRALGSWASRVGSELASADIASMQTIQEALGAYREISVTDRRSLYIRRVQDLRWRAARVLADNQFIGMFPKYMFEAALVVGGFALAAVLFATENSVTAVGTLALFLAAGTRVTPSLLRLQGAALGMRHAAGAAAPTFALAADLQHPKQDPEAPATSDQIRERIRDGHRDFIPSIEIRGVTYTYPDADQPALRDVDLSIAPGRSVALVGPSGAGKSTLADVILGLVVPDKGEALLGGVAPSLGVTRWPGAIGYVPQDILVTHDTIRANVALGLPADAIDDDLVWEALQRAHLDGVVRGLPEGIDTPVGERGARLSGGQRQRLGIARALYTRPGLLVLDEATSALDAETEQAVTRTLHELEGGVTTVVIAHRLSTVRDLDVVAYIDGGSIIASGSFDEVVGHVPGFERQAGLMGRTPDQA